MNYLKNISFIIITLNEEFAVKKCLNSLCKMNLINCEIICVDSASSDNTLSVIKSYNDKLNNLKVFVIDGYVNAAIARNTGIKNSSNEYIMFVDGDVELYEEFLYTAYNKINKTVGAVRGDLIEYQYLSNYTKLLKKINSRCNITTEKLVYLAGGIFLTTKRIINEIGLFNENYEKSQDWEFTLRLTKKYKMLALPLPMGIHHTIPYHNKKRIIHNLINLHDSYSGMVLRKNLFYLNGLKACYIANSGRIIFSFILLFFLFIIIFLPFTQSLLIIGSLIFLDIFYGIYQKKDIFYRLIIHYIAPFFFVFGLLFNINKRKNYSINKIIL